LLKKAILALLKRLILYIDLVKYFLPDGILDYFEIVGDRLQNDRVHFYLEEKNILPQEYQSEIAHSKGFSPEITVEDFPLRGKSVLLHIKRRRWTLVKTGKIVKRDWNMVAKGTRITNEFASFLKDIS
jgi:hypothetical protein